MLNSILKKKEKKLEITVEESINAVIIYLNRKFPKLQEVTDKYSERIKKLKDGNVNKAFSSSSDPTEQINLYNDFLNNYSREIGYIRDLFNGIKDTSNSIEDERLKETKEIFNLMESNTEKVRNLRLNDTKSDIEFKLKILFSEDSSYEKAKLIKQISKLMKELNSLFDKKELILPKSLKRDFNQFESIIKRKKFEKNSLLSLRWYVGIGIFLLMSLTGVAIWIIMK